ncbi:MAG: UDP-N-acetylmuramoyl-L-alanyl-D-glutamate--2,6-diaminopimelate ligase [Ruminococcaceae bacterium]|nr:UDP-N-acetylmuramoyl-L-alanyl-D-glutamate--2,6-diaminopimelate ligase [Oscillospiraceae bacterium]
MTLEQLLKGVRIQKTNIDLGIEVSVICSDTRKVTPNCVFVCIKGQKYDSHRAAQSVVAKGAAVLICEKQPEEDLPYVLVDNTRAANTLMQANLVGNPQREFSFVIGITGTNGKTSTSCMIKAIFDKAGFKTGLLGTMKYLIGDEEYSLGEGENLLTTPDPELLFPLLRKMREGGVEVLIMEASSHALKLEKLAAMHFDIAIFTNLTQDHLDFHKDMDEYLECKKKLFALSDKLLVNLDDPSYERIVAGCPCEHKTFSGKGNNSAQYNAKNVRMKGARGVEYELLSLDGIFRIKLGIPGEFSVSNSLAASACAMEAGISAICISGALAEMDNVKGRIDRVDIDAPYSVFIDFAHTPDALENVIKTVRGFCDKRIITLFGCGGDRDRTKRPLMAEVASRLSDYVVVTSDNSRSEEKADIIKDILEGITKPCNEYAVIEDRSEAIRYAMDIAGEGDVIILAGKGHEEYEIDKNGKHPYSEREVVKEHFYRGKN